MPVVQQLRSIRIKALLSAVTVIAAGFAPVYSAQAATYPAVADAYTRSSDPNTNYGMKAKVRAQKWAKTTGFVKFNLDALSGSTIESATLRIPVEDVRTSGGVTVHRALGHWSETRITHKNKPALSNALASFNVSGSNAGKVISVNVTLLVRQMISNGSNSIAFVTANANVGMGTHNNGSAIRLDVSTSGGSGGANNTAPTISGNPASSVIANTSYGFTPQALDHDGDSLTFSISNKPSWAAFNTGTGRLSGVPTDSQVGLHGNISITASDGQASARLGPFEIEVTEDGSGSASLSWKIPTQNTDGTPLRDLARFRIDWTRTNNGAKGSVKINNPSVSSYVVENLAAGTYEFRVVAINDQGIVSVPSNKAVKTVN